MTSSCTVQAAGLWPSATLSARPVASVELTVRTVSAREGSAIVVARPDERVAAVAARAFAALPAALPGVRASEACRLVWNGRVLDGTKRVADEGLPRSGGVVVLCRPKPSIGGRPREVRTCRICLEDEEEGDSSRMVSPCLCDGSMRYVHVDCLNRWRAMAPGARSRFRCDQCGYEYRVRRTTLGTFLASETGALAVAGCLLGVSVYAAGASLEASLAKRERAEFYRALRLAPPKHRPIDVAILGMAAVGLACFSLYALEHALAAWYHRRLGVDLRVAVEPAGLLALWVAAETLDLRRARALAVVGFSVAARVVYYTTVRLARKIALRLGESVLDVHRRQSS
ncbi:hypothetical protein CTAYLR_006411 [Chrysophaeum taylorii]|uniref:RING-CH-type domain-containing protein n=1 Tax=Chrysophaeum taylorii TaxID=2483200 RepID=A0AAD7U9S5_9STRA|nr:hypothetical protein CTAYLR_006411 [Chrysophaeum taylorii]